MLLEKKQFLQVSKLSSVHKLCILNLIMEVTQISGKFKAALC